MLFLTVFLERKSGTTGVPFGRTELSICGNGTDFYALLRRGGPVGPFFQKMLEKPMCHVIFELFRHFLKFFMSLFS